MLRFIRNLTFEKIYFFIVFLYGARATVFTANMDFRYNPLGVALLILPTIHLFIKYKLSLFDKRIYTILLGLTAWVLLRFFIDPQFNMFNYYTIYIQILVCYTVVNIYKQIIPLYFEQITVRLSIIAIALWIVMQFVGVKTIASLGFMEPYTSISSASLLIFNTPNYTKEGIGILGLTRNCGFAWEPGLYSCFLIFAIFFNLCRVKRLKGNTNFFILVLALLTTSSTTGYSVFLFVIINHLFIQNSRFKYKVPALIIFIPTIIWISQLSFMSDKIKETSKTENFLSKNETVIDYFENEGGQMVVQRFEGLYLNYLNFINAPILGYGYRGNSYSATHISSKLATSEGIISFFAQFGIFIGLYIFFTYYKSAKYFDIRYHYKYNMLFYVYILVSISYNFNFVAIVMAFMWYPILLKPRKKAIATRQIEPKKANKFAINKSKSY